MQRRNLALARPLEYSARRPAEAHFSIRHSPSFGERVRLTGQTGIRDALFAMGWNGRRLGMGPARQCI